MQVHSYHSYVSLLEDVNAGLIGPHFVYAPGKLNTTVANSREFPLLYMTYAEGQSWLSGENLAKLNGTMPMSSSDVLDKDMPAGNTTVWKPQNVNIEGAGQFMGAPTFYSMNG